MLSLRRTQSKSDLARRGDVSSAGWTLQMPDGSVLLLIRSAGGWRTLPVGGLDIAGKQTGPGVQMNHTQSWKVWETLGYNSYSLRKELVDELAGVMLALGYS